jgi:parallel beta helix pectate lyase-like protein
MRLGFLSPLTRSRAFLCLALCSLGLLVLPVTGAQAQSTKIFVASFGSDANDGSRGSPKRNFQAAHDAVAAGGEVVALDTAGYGALTITKSVGITVPAGITGFITVTSSDAISINASGATVTLRGLTLNSIGGGTGIGVSVTDVGALEVNNCVITGFSDSGIKFGPATAATLLVKNTSIRGGGAGSSCILVPSAIPENVKVVLAGCRLFGRNGSGLNIGSGSASHRVEARDCVISGIGAGINVNGANHRLVAKDCTLSANTATAISLVTSGATANVDGCTITGNSTGLNAAAGANLLSRGNNTVEDNNSNGTFTGTYSAK